MWKARLSELEFDERELQEVLDTIDSEWITAGPRTQMFESAFARFTGTAEAVAVSNGTAALFLALKGLGIGPGDEVLVPSMTFVATAAAVIHCGAEPVLVDICSLENPTMSPDDAAKKITRRTKAILPVHYAGIPADMDRLSALAARRGLLLVEDAAHAPGARFAGNACGSWGSAGCFSFFGNKNMTTAEGGMVTTNDTALAKRLRSLRSHGMTVSSWDREKGRPAHYDVLEVGFNFRFDDIRAALGLVQLQKLPALNAQRAELVRRYNDRFWEAKADLVLPFAKIDGIKEPSHHIYPILLPTAEARDSMAAHLKEEGIQSSIHYPPIHHFSAFRKSRPALQLPLTEAFAARELTLPLYPSLSEAQVDTIAAAVVNGLSVETRPHHYVAVRELDPAALRLLEQEQIEYTLNPYGRRLREAEVADLIGPYEVMIAGTEPLTEAVLNRASHLRLIAHTGIGLDNINLDAARARGIAVTYTPAAPSPAVAELVIGQMLALLRKTPHADRELRQGVWNRHIGRRLGELTIGVIGMGRVGRLVIQHLDGFNPPRVLANDLVVDEEFAQWNGFTWTDKDTIYREADIITLHVPLTGETRGLIGERELEMMKPDAILINTSRGEIVKEAALANALRTRPAFSAAIDVFEEEPYSGELTKLENCLLSCHMGSCTRDCRLQMELEAAREVVRYFRGEPAATPVP